MHELVVVDSLGAIVRLGQMLLQQVPEVLEIFFLKDLCRLILQEAGSRLLAHFEIKRLLLSGLLKEELWDRFV